MPRLTGRDGRSRLPLLVAAIVLVAALALGAYFLRARSGTPEAAPAEKASTAPDTSSGDDDPAPTGCLGGQARTVDMVLAARRSAPHTTFGAVEVAAALMRWGLRYPYPTSSQLTQIRPALSPSTARTQESNLAKEYAAGYRPLPGRSDPTGTPYYVTTANGDWLVSAGSPSDQVTVEIAAHPVVDDAYSTTSVALRLDLQWGASGWQLRELARADPAVLANGGTTFTSGC